MCRPCRSSSIVSGSVPRKLFSPGPKKNRWAFWRGCLWPADCLPASCDATPSFAANDHRNFNRRGQSFDVGETFSGVDYEIGLAAVEEMRKLLPSGVTMSQFALRWILMFDAVTCAIPGGKRAEQVADNCRASDLPALTPMRWPRYGAFTTRRFGRWYTIAGERDGGRLWQDWRLRELSGNPVTWAVERCGVPCSYLPERPLSPPVLHAGG